MRRTVCLYALLPMLGSVLHADWKIVTKTGDSVVAEFFKGALRRTDSSPADTEVLDFEHRSQVNWRSDLRQYVVIEWPPVLRNDSSPGQVIVIERNTTDTGERKQVFGRTARHLVTRVTRNEGQETVIDGWYVAAPGLPKWNGGAGAYVAVLTLSNQKSGPPRIQVKQTGPAPEGLGVWLKTTSSIALPGGSRQIYESVSEVTELVEGSLPDKLFRPPDGYQRVESLPNRGLQSSGPERRTWFELLQGH
jgi:hypothetical protein